MWTESSKHRCGDEAAAFAALNTLLADYAADPDLEAFDKTLVDKAAIDKLLESDLAEAKRCNANATPTILINGLKLTDRSVEGYRSRITTLLAQPAPAGESPPEGADAEQ